MAYKILPQGEEKTTWYPVTVESRDKAGKITKDTWQAKFLIPSQDEINELIGPDSDDVNDQRVLDKVLKGWKEVEDAEGEPLEFNPHNVAQMMSEFPARPSTVRAWLDCIGKMGKRKN